MNTINVVTSIGLFDDPVGKRISLTYSVIDETGKILEDNKRIDRVVVDSEALTHISALTEYAKTLIPEGE